MLLNPFKLFFCFITVGRAFQKCIPFTEYDDWPKVVERIATLWLPLSDPLVTLLLAVPFTCVQSTAGARSLMKITDLQEDLQDHNVDWLLLMA